jgi:TRAP-type transport system small permease protein
VNTTPKDQSAFGWLTQGVTRALELTIVACLTVMAMLVFGNVVLRYGFDSGIAVSEELARLLFVWLVFLGAILASRQQAHIGFDSPLKSLPFGLKKFVSVLTGCLMLSACLIFVIGGWQQTLINLDNSYPVLGISYAWLYGSAIVFGIGMAISILFNLWDTINEQNPMEKLTTAQARGVRP